jgi:hypothetical protein
MSTPREIILQAMNLDRPSRTPLMCQLSIGHMLLQLGVSPVEFWHDPDIFSEGLCRLREIYTFDGVLVSLHGHDPEWRSAIQSRQSSPAGEEVTWRDGTKLRYLANDLPQPVIEEDAKSPSPKSMVDSLPESLDYIPVSQGLRFLIHPDHTFDVFLKVRTRLGENYSLHGEITSPFDYFLDAYGHQSGLMYLLTDPERSKEILGRYASLVEDLAVQMCATGVDAIKLSSPFAGAGFISPDLYCDFVLPFERQIAGAVRAEGVHIYTHTCGAISDRLELMLDAGVSGIECLDPARWTRFHQREHRLGKHASVWHKGSDTRRRKKTDRGGKGRRGFHPKHGMLRGPARGTRETPSAARSSRTLGISTIKGGKRRGPSDSPLGLSKPRRSFEPFSARSASFGYAIQNSQDAFY